jgi:hypothetical protein
VRALPELPEVTWASGPIDPAALSTWPIVWARAAPLPLEDDAADAMARVASKCWQFENLQREEERLPGARVVRSPDELRGADLPARWVLKGAYGAAGRERVFGAGPALEDADREAAERLLAAHGAALLEPWVERVADAGAWWDGDRGAAVQGMHGVAVDARGRFRGIAVRAGVPAPAEMDRFFELYPRVHEALGKAGYGGPFGIDAFRYRREDGTEALHAPCEVNPRLTFGRIAFEFYERIAVHRWGEHGPVGMALRFGEAPEPAGDPDRVSLVGSADGALTYAWLESALPGHSVGLNSRWP